MWVLIFNVLTTALVVYIIFKCTRNKWYKAEIKEYPDKMNYFEFSSLVALGGKIKLKKEDITGYSNFGLTLKNCITLYNDLLSFNFVKKTIYHDYTPDEISRSINITVDNVEYSFVSNSDVNKAIRDILKKYKKLNTLQNLDKKEKDGIQEMKQKSKSSQRIIDLLQNKIIADRKLAEEKIQADKIIKLDKLVL